MKEDYLRIRVNPEIMATLRSFALNTLRSNKSKNIRGNIYYNTIDLPNVF